MRPRRHHLSSLYTVTDYPSENDLHIRFHVEVMNWLSHLTVEELREKLLDVEGKKPALRLVVAINYKQGVPQTTIAEWYGLSRKTVYNWLTQFESESLDRALYDEPSPGRPRKLTDKGYDQLTTDLHRPPFELGYDAKSWTSELIGHHIKETLDVEYSDSSLQRIMRQHDLS